MNGAGLHARGAARVPVEIRGAGQAKRRSIGSSPTELVNAAYDYVLATGELPDAQRGESPLRITLTDAQANELRFRLRQATRPVPASFWEARDGAPATREGE